MKPDPGHAPFALSAEDADTAALLARHAPPPADTDRGVEAVMARLPQAVRRSPQGRLLRLASPLAAAAVIACAVLLALWPNGDPATSPPNTPSAAENPAAQPREQTVAHFRVREISGERVILDGGLADGLRVGDRLVGPHGEALTVAEVGVFFARARPEEPSLAPARGARVAVESGSSALLRAQDKTSAGGDPGAFFAFGAVFDPLPPQRARELGLADGRAIVVVETIGALAESRTSEPKATPAALLGLQEGDVLLDLNGLPVRDFAEFVQALEMCRRAPRWSLRILRGSRELTLTLER